MAYELGKVIFLSGLCDRELGSLLLILGTAFLSGLCDRERWRCFGRWLRAFLSGLCDRERAQAAYSRA